MAFLLLMHIGPVQAFIAQARRSRDLWFGSHLLVEISKSAADAISKQKGVDLIFPALDASGNLPESVANKILAVVEENPREIALAARTAARDKLRKIWDEVKPRVEAVMDPDADKTAAEQVDTLLEFMAAFVPIAEDGYVQARHRVEDELAARKNLRAFSPWYAQRGGVHKSSLDGARETILRGGTARKEIRSQGTFKQYRIGLREELDAIGLLKRAGGQPGQFVPVPTIGLAAYTTLADGPALETLKAECERLKFPPVSVKQDWIRRFPFDAQILLPDRWKPYFADLGCAENASQFGARFVKPIRDLLGEPYPYVACLCADGDRMGKAIDGLQDADAHRRFSQELAKFPGIARTIIESKRGQLVYAGGDDVMAFVCVADALACAKELHEAFDKLMAAALPDMAERPTLSVGIGIGHVLQSLGELLEGGREAEKLAKTKRNALAIIVEKHAGASRAWCASVNDAPSERLLADIEKLAAFPMKKVHQVGAMLARMPKPEDLAPEEANDWARLLRNDTRATLARAESGTDPQPFEPKGLGLDLHGESYRDVYEAVSRWVSRMCIAAELALATPRKRDGKEARR